MPGAVRATLQGQSTLRRKLRQLPNAVRTPELQGALRRGAEPIRADASQRAPRLTGFLAQNIEAKVASGEAEVRVTPGDALYGRFVERGTRHVPPRPFLLPAFETKKGAAIKIVSRELADDVIREARR